MKFATALMDTGVERALEALQGKASAPITIELWDGRSYPLGTDPAVKLKILRASALRSLANPTLGSLAEAYVEGDIDVEGRLGDVVHAADQLVSGSGPGAWKRVALVAGKHSRKTDREAIHHHYDVSNAFYR